jgi:hypothetical protein
MRTVGLEMLGQKIFRVHRSRSLLSLRHIDDERKPADVTDGPDVSSETDKTNGDKSCKPE